MSRLTWVIILSLAVLYSCSGKSSTSTITIKGKIITPTNATRIFISNHQDTVFFPLQGQSFDIEAVVKKPGIYRIGTNASSGKSIWLNSGDIHLTLETKRTIFHPNDLSIVEVSGHPETEMFDSLRMKWFRLRADFIFSEPGRNYDSLQNIIYPEVLDFVSKNPRSYLSHFFIMHFRFNEEKEKHLVSLLDRKADPVAIDSLETFIRHNEREVL